MRTFKFEKEEDNNWYVVLPEWEGNKEALQMVAGADVMLDILGKGNSTVKLKISLEEFDDSSVLDRIRILEGEGCGADYVLHEWEGKYLNLEMWLCAVTEWIFGFMPERIYFKKV